MLKRFKKLRRVKDWKCKIANPITRKMHSRKKKQIYAIQKCHRTWDLTRVVLSANERWRWKPKCRLVWSHLLAWKSHSLQHLTILKGHEEILSFLLYIHGANSHAILALEIPWPRGQTVVEHWISPDAEQVATNQAGNAARHMSHMRVGKGRGRLRKLSWSILSSAACKYQKSVMNEQTDQLCH